MRKTSNNNNYRNSYESIITAIAIDKPEICQQNQVFKAMWKGQQVRSESDLWEYDIPRAMIEKFPGPAKECCLMDGTWNMIMLIYN